MALDSTWQIIPDGATTPVVANTLGVSDLKRTRKSVAIDTVEVTVDGRNVDAASLFAFGSTVTIRRGDVQWFVGRVTQTPATGNGPAQSHRYTLSGPWWYLTKLAYRQEWKFAGGNITSYSGRLILGQDLDNSYVTTGAVITEALQYVIDAAAANDAIPAFQIGAIPLVTPPSKVSSTILTGYVPPLDEVKDVTVEEVLRKMERWHPDAVGWFDYATTPPTFHFQARANLTAATLTLGAPPFVSVGRITPRYDLQAPAVVIHYEVPTTNNGATSTSLVTDAALAAGVTVPAGFDAGQLYGAVVLTIPLHGSSTTTVEQRINTVAIKDAVGASGLVAYLKGRCAALAADVNDPSITAEGVTITSCTRGLADDTAQKYNEETGEYEADSDYDDSLGYELVDGAFTDWMVSQYRLKKQVHRIIFEWTADDSANGTTGGLAPAKASFDLVATNASAQLYTTETSFTAGDAPPSGLAAAYLATISDLQWSGTVEMVEPVAGASVPGAALGSVLNLAGGANRDWATMNALIVAEETTASTGHTELTLGPAMHLSPQDMVARLYLTRPGGTGGREGGGAKGTHSSAARTTGNTGGPTVPGSTQTPIKGGGTLLSGAGTASTPLSPYRIDDTHVGVTYGTICGQQPGEFAAGDLPPCSIAVSGSGYLYASAVYDFTSLTWTAPDVSDESDPNLANTSTTAYALIGSYSTGNDGTLTVVSALAGDVDFDPCDLAQDNGS